MASEITVSGKITATKAGVSATATKASLAVTMVGTLMSDIFFSTSNVEAAIPKGSVGTMGYCYFENMSTAGIITLRAVSGGSPFATLGVASSANLGGFCVVPAGLAGPFYCIASAGTPILRCFIIEA